MDVRKNSETDSGYMIPVPLRHKEDNIMYETDSVYFIPVASDDEDIYELLHLEGGIKEKTNTDTEKEESKVKGKNACKNIYINGSDVYNAGSHAKKQSERGTKRCIVVNYPEEEHQQQDLTLHASRIQQMKPRVVIFTALTSVTIFLFCAVYFPLNYGGHSSSIDEKNLSAYIQKQVTAYDNTLSDDQTTYSTLELVTFKSQLKDKNEKTKFEKKQLKSRTITPRIRITKLVNFKKTIAKQRTSTIQKTTQKNQVINMNKQSGKKHFFCHEDGNKEYNEMDYTEIIAATNIKKTLTINISISVTEYHPFEIQIINNKLWLNNALYMYVFNQNGVFVHKLKISSGGDKFYQTFTGDIVARQIGHNEDANEIVIYSKTFKKLSIIKQKHTIDDISTHGCQFSVLFCSTNEIKTYRHFPSEQKWKFHSSLKLNRKITYEEECRCVIHNNIYVGSILHDHVNEIKYKIYQFSKEGMFLKQIVVKGYLNLLGIDRNGWLLVHHYSKYMDPKFKIYQNFRIYNSTSLMLHRNFKVDERDMVDEKDMLDTIVDNQNNIWLLTEYGIIKYTV